VNWLSTQVAPGADQAVVLATFRSCQERTVPVSVTLQPAALTLIVLRSTIPWRRRALADATSDLCHLDVRVRLGNRLVEEGNRAGGRRLRGQEL
jgi:hypothetical protein